MSARSSMRSVGWRLWSLKYGWWLWRVGSLRAAAEGLMSLRGVGLITAVTVLAELGDFTRFDNARQLMSFVVLVPGERSSGSKRRQTGITKTGNAHVRRVLAEAAWSYRFPARKTAVLQRRAERTSPAVQTFA